jgi:hypothetical protein
MPSDINDPGNPENKVRTRTAQAELRRMFLRWDPIGVSGDPEAADEYDCMISPLMHQLYSGTTSAAVSQRLVQELEEHFGMSANLKREDRFAAEVMLWWTTRMGDAQA